MSKKQKHDVFYIKKNHIFVETDLGTLAKILGADEFMRVAKNEDRNRRCRNKSPY